MISISTSGLGKRTSRFSPILFATGGSATQCAAFGSSGGLVLGNATGGDRGIGTLNVATGIYLNNTAYTNPDFVFERHYTGKIERFAKRPGAREYSGLLPLAELERYTRENLRLPGINNTPHDIFERADIALRYIEELILYLIDHDRRLSELEAAVEKAEASNSRERTDPAQPAVELAQFVS